MKREKYLISEDATIGQAIAAIDWSDQKIALVVDDNVGLLGTVTDGDVRRAILRGVDLESPAREIMNRSPTVANSGDSDESVLALMKRERLHQIPFVNEEGRVVGIKTIDDIMADAGQDNLVVLMAGGLGTRLRPLTDKRPKPLLELGSKPLLETILKSLTKYGFRRFFISVNYKAEMVKAYFGDGSRWNVDIRYIEEDERLGTGGALTLLPEKPTAPFLVMNGDLLTNINFRHLLDYHHHQSCKVTMCVCDYENQIPYGVVGIENQRVAALMEKPVQRYFINAGIYVLEPEVLSQLPTGEVFDMTTLIDRLVADKSEVAVFPIREFWLDIGHHEDYERAAGHYRKLFT